MRAQLHSVAPGGLSGALRMDLSTDIDTFIFEAMSVSGEKILVNPRFAPRGGVDNAGFLENCGDLV